MTPAEELRARLECDPGVDLVSLCTDTDRALSIGREVWRLRWRGQVATAVTGAADLETSCGALLDALAVREAALDEGYGSPADPRLDLSGLHVLIDRPLPGNEPSETDQALRSLRDSVQGVAVGVWYQRAEQGWVEDRGPAPVWDRDDARVTGWVDRLLLPRLAAEPAGIALALVEAVNDASLHLYPSEITDKVDSRWALRIDGLEIGTADRQTATLEVGKPGKSGDGPQRRAFTEVFGRPRVSVSIATPPAPGALSVGDAAEFIRELLRRFRATKVPGEPVTHRFRGGTPLVDEHGLEARLLKGLIRLPEGWGLLLDDARVARGSQFPTLWGLKTQARYLDAMLSRGATPLAVELKVATGGQGRYYRRALSQAVLYRHFIRHAPGLDPWFARAGLDRTATEAAVGIPAPRRWTPEFDRKLEQLRRVAARVDATVYVLDDRATPDWDVHTTLPDPPRDEQEALTWQLAAALSRRWPRSLGRVVETHPAGGLYDIIQLQHHQDARIETPWLRVRVSMNRPGSARVCSPTGEERWVWRGIWNHLADDGDPREAAAIIGAIAQLPDTEHSDQPTFPDLAAAFLKSNGDPTWRWRCAWQDGHTPEWVNRYRTVLSRYSRGTRGNALPTIARIWGALRNEQAAVIVDQRTLRAWIWDQKQPREVAVQHFLEQQGQRQL